VRSRFVRVSAQTEVKLEAWLLAHAQRTEPTDGDQGLAELRDRGVQRRAGACAGRGGGYNRRRVCPQ
jgi:hypothetical protein